MKHLIKQLSQKNISFNPLYRELTGSLAGGLYLSQLMYWFGKKDKIYKTDKAIMSETTLTERELRTAKKLIKKLPFITVSKEGIPAKTYYEIDWEIFAIVISKIKNNKDTNSQKVKTVTDETTSTVLTKRQDSDSQKVETNIVKSFDRDYTENTTESACVKKEPITPFEIISFYKKNISSLQDKIKEQKSYSALLLQADRLEEIFIGLKNYKYLLDANIVEKKYVKSLKNFIEDKTYLDFQKDTSTVNEWTSHGKESNNSNEDWK